VVQHRRTRQGLKDLRRFLLDQKRVITLEVQDIITLKTAVKALEEGACNTLRVLELSQLNITDEEIRVLAAVFRSGSCSKLQSLGVNQEIEATESLTHTGVSLLMEALGKYGSCPQLLDLGLAGNYKIGKLGGFALAEALETGHLRCLQGALAGRGGGKQNIIVLLAMTESDGGGLDSSSSSSSYDD